MSTEMDSKDVCAVLQPLFDVGDIRELNGPTGFRLAQLIYPRNAADLTVREVLALLAQIESEWRARGWRGDAP